eukprot:6202620-Pleurochrysis_carterae.AAC.1
MAASQSKERPVPPRAAAFVHTRRPGQSLQLDNMTSPAPSPRVPPMHRQCGAAAASSLGDGMWYATWEWLSISIGYRGLGD